MNKQFLDILYNLSHELGLTLYPDSNDACKLHLSNQHYVQLEMDRAEEHINAVCKIIEIPLGKFKENVLKHALVANYNLTPFEPCLSYVQKNNTLTLYQKIPLKHLNPSQLVDSIVKMGLKAQDWKQAIESGRPGPNVIKTMPQSSPPLGSNIR
jgi:hypothetical protein